MNFTFDRTAFKTQTFEEEQVEKKFKKSAVTERLEISYYLNSVAFAFDVTNSPKMDRTVFSMRKLNTDK
jgi:hypothetical protein